MEDEKIKKIDYFDGAEWYKIDIDKISTWFSCEVNWDNVKDVREHGTKYLEVNMKNGHTYYYEDVYGHYARPVRFR